jgi:hypothetical protein
VFQELLEAGFRRQGIQSYIPGVGKLQVRPLAVKGVSDHMRALPESPPPAKRQRPIIVSTSHAQSPAATVDSNQGCDDEIQPLRRDGVSHAARHRDAEHPGGGRALQWVEAQAAMTLVADDGDENAHAARPGRGNQPGSFGFPVEG